MRLLQLRPDNELVLTDNLIHDIPPYAILSHTWGSDGDEVTFQDLMEGRGKDKSGYGKIIFCGQQAKRDHLHYFWVDTCCIDKTSSAELTEAINSMFNWYRNAQTCYVYLTDVSKEDAVAQDGELSHLNWKSAFRESRWFNRGWTLQELLAPSKVEFFSATKQRLGDKKSLEQTIHEITRIPLRALQGYALSEFTIDERISWSNSRRTKRPEDRAYSLLGILGVYVSLIYGEGEENAFTRIRATIDQKHETNTGLGNASDKSKALHHYIPFPKNRRFTGRDGILVDIQKRLFGVESCQKLAVVGLGGMGKTQLALQLAYWVKERRPEYSVLWIPALSFESFEQTTTEIAKRLGVKKETDDEDIKTSLLRHLELEYDRKWFLVVDNADDMDILYGSTASGGEGIYQYLPTTDNCIILFTTRLRDVALSVTGTDVIELGEMSSEEATNFFAKATIHRNDLEESSIVKELLEELTFLPLAIAQAAAYLNRNRLSVKRYLELLRSTGKEMVSLMSTEFRDITRYRGSKNAVATTWLVSFDQIRETDSIAADILLFISLIEPRAIPRRLLPQANTEAEMEQALGTLCGYAFLTDRGNGLYDVHRLVHIAAKVWNHKQNPQETITNALRHVNRIFPTSLQTNQKLWRAYLAHAIRLLDESDQCHINTRYDLFFQVGQCLYEDRRHIDAVQCLEQAEQWYKSRLSEDGMSKLIMDHWLAAAYLNAGQIQKAISILEHVVDIQTQTLNEEDIARLASEHDLARAYLENGQIQKAISILEHVVDIQTQTLNEEDIDHLASKDELAWAYLKDGQIQKAISILEDVVDIGKRARPQTDRNQLNSQHRLGRAYFEDGQIQKAISILEDVVDIGKRVGPQTDRNQLCAQYELGRVYFEDGQTTKAIGMLESVARIEAQVLAEDDKYRLSTLGLLNEAYGDLEQFSQPMVEPEIS
ncbi:putative Heterokaryon incompatibility domain-containing protein [Seiridium unicorne]|uniref:Heterokaryon incompatibility domain-containing protein n=1 Tax=Seiridium unicorne TaxID=138068 RepID=A0ABR2UI34_9PEZI